MKIKLKKEWAAVARKAMGGLVTNPHGKVSWDKPVACCEAIEQTIPGNINYSEKVMPILEAFRKFINPKRYGYWWAPLDDWFETDREFFDALTARIIALELFALACEEETEI